MTFYIFIAFSPGSPTVKLRTESSIDFQNAPNPLAPPKKKKIRLRAGRVGVRIPREAKGFSPKFQTNSGAQPAHIHCLLRSFPGGKAAGGREINNTTHLVPGLRTSEAIIYSHTPSWREERELYLDSRFITSDQQCTYCFIFRESCYRSSIKWCRSQVHHHMGDAIIYREDVDTIQQPFRKTMKLFALGKCK
jgi:hypothetical protein